MNFIELLPLAVSAAGGGAAPATGFVSVAGAGTTGTDRDGPGTEQEAVESKLNRLTHELGQVVFRMSKKLSGFPKSENLAPDIAKTEETTAPTPFEITPEAVVAEMKEAMRFLASPNQPGDTHKTFISRAARAAGLSTYEGRVFWYGLNKEPKAHLVDRVRVAVKRKLKNEIAALEHRTAVLKRLAMEPA